MTTARAALAAALTIFAVTAIAPAADADVTVGFAKRKLAIQGEDTKERAAISCGKDGNVRVNGKNPATGPAPCAKVVEIDLQMGGGSDIVDATKVSNAFGETKFEGFGSGTGVAALLGLGNDRYVGSPSAFNLAYGEEGDDRAKGGRARDILVGGNGDDVLNGMGGSDSLFGFGGMDRLLGGPGGDKLFGGPGKDKLRGGPGKDKELQGG